MGANKELEQKIKIIKLIGSNKSVFTTDTMVYTAIKVKNNWNVFCECTYAKGKQVLELSRYEYAFFVLSDNKTRYLLRLIQERKRIKCLKTKKY